EPAHASRLGDVTAIHSWIFNGTAQKYGAMSPQSLRHAEYLTELSGAFATEPDRSVWLQEIGAPLNVLEAAEAPDFCTRAVRHAADCTNLWGVTWWCSHDVDRSLADFPPLEYSLGLIDAEGRVKPIGRAFADLAAELRARPVPRPGRQPRGGRRGRRRPARRPPQPGRLRRGRSRVHGVERPGAAGPATPRGHLSPRRGPGRAGRPRYRAPAPCRARPARRILRRL